MSCNLSGVFLVYRLNDCIDQNKDLKFNIKSFLSFPFHKAIIVMLVTVIIPLALFYLNHFVFLILSLAAIFGIIYSINFKFGNVYFRLKNIFLIKNIMIGITWGSLILIGSGSIDPIIIKVFIFTSIQVFLGGMIRDIPDLDKDSIQNVKSFPVVFGISRTIVFMHIINLGTVFIFSFIDFQLTILLFAIPSLWRCINLTLLGFKPNNPNWSQWMNLFTCILLFLMVLISIAYEYNIK